MKSHQIAERIARLQARQQQAEARERLVERRRRTHASIVVGALMLAHPEEFGLSASYLIATLDRLVRRPHDRRALRLKDLPGTE